MKLELTEQEIENVLNCLAQLPFNQVAQLITKIQVQAQQQITEQAVAPQTEEE